MRKDPTSKFFIHMCTIVDKVKPQNQPRNFYMFIVDATYKTTNYALILFFICVKTNNGYAIVVMY